MIGIFFVITTGILVALGGDQSDVCTDDPYLHCSEDRISIQETKTVNPPEETGDWPGHGKGDKNHDHGGPPDNPPGQNTPPGQR